ncbi:C2H2 finger domain transcription factor mtfA [Mycena kentingensis (nom. inval.)]|nr:C2H2 finger domain transcription factor mtfA [Mycena kentingensis (nom. inval.)]
MANCVLPSFKEMFPDHLFNQHPTLPQPHVRPRAAFRARAAAPAKAYTRPAPYSFDVLKSEPRAPSLKHIASSAAHSRSRSRSQSPSEGSVDACDELEDGHEHGHADPSSSSSGRKHICATCQKRFNRPSSLRIHMNTHSGATPYRCPHPGCGRAFNVSSNMRRHLRNHAATSGTAPRSPQTPSTVSASSPTSPLSGYHQSPPASPPAAAATAHWVRVQDASDTVVLRLPPISSLAPDR